MIYKKSKLFTRHATKTASLLLRSDEFRHNVTSLETTKIIYKKIESQIHFYMLNAQIYYLQAPLIMLHIEAL